MGTQAGVTTNPPSGAVSGQASTQMGTQAGATTNPPSGTVSGQTGTSTAMGGTSSDLQQKIEQAIKSDNTLANANIIVKVSDSNIELSGTATTGKDKQTARRIAQSFAGNRKVVDKITVNGRGNSGMGNKPSSTEKPPMSEKPPANPQPLV